MSKDTLSQHDAAQHHYCSFESDPGDCPDLVSRNSDVDSNNNFVDRVQEEAEAEAKATIAAISKN